MKMLDLLPLLVVMPLVSGFESFGTVCHCKTLCTCDGLSEYMGCKKPCTGIFGDTTLLHSCSSFKVQCWDDLSIGCTEMTPPWASVAKQPPPRQCTPPSGRPGTRGACMLFSSSWLSRLHANVCATFAPMLLRRVRSTKRLKPRS